MWEQWEELSFVCPLSNQLGGHPLIAFVCWKSVSLSFPPCPRPVSTALTLCGARSSPPHLLAALISFPSPLVPAHLRKKIEEDEDRFFQLGGSRWMCWLRGLPRCCCCPLWDPPAVYRARPRGSGKWWVSFKRFHPADLLTPPTAELIGGWASSGQGSGLRPAAFRLIQLGLGLMNVHIYIPKRRVSSPALSKLCISARLRIKFVWFFFFNSGLIWLMTSTVQAPEPSHPSVPSGGLLCLGASIVVRRGRHYL